MKNFQVIQLSSMWSSNTLIEKVEQKLNEKSKEGWQVVSVSFSFNKWFLPTAYITLSIEK